MTEIMIRELSIGDWAMNLYANKPSRVIGLRVMFQDTYEIIAVSDDTQYILIEDNKELHNFEPIPLTPEILEKNGLCVVEEDADFSEYELFGSENFSIFHIKGTLHYRLEAPQASVVCWNVHQLQNALRLAGVEKEIEV